jgi:putative sterol carrier protein
MEAKTPKEFLEEQLPKRFNPEKASGVNVTVQVNVTGEDGGDWTVTIKDQQLDVKQGSQSNPDLSLQMADKDFVDLVNRKMSAERAFFTGKVKFKGNIALALKLRDAGFL